MDFTEKIFHPTANDTAIQVQQRKEETSILFFVPFRSINNKEKNRGKQ